MILTLNKMCQPLAEKAAVSTKDQCLMCIFTEKDGFVLSPSYFGKQKEWGTYLLEAA